MYGDVFLTTNNVPYTTMHMGDGLNARVRFDTANGGQPLDTNTKSHHNSHVWVGDPVYVADLDSYPQQDQAPPMQLMPPQPTGQDSCDVHSRDLMQGAAEQLGVDIGEYIVRGGRVLPKE